MLSIHHTYCLHGAISPPGRHGFQVTPAVRTEETLPLKTQARYRYLLHVGQSVGIVFQTFPF